MYYELITHRVSGLGDKLSSEKSQGEHFTICTKSLYYHSRDSFVVFLYDIVLVVATAVGK